MFTVLAVSVLPVILSMLRRSRLLAWCGRGFARLDDAADRAWRRWRGLPARATGAAWVGVVANRVLWVLLGLLAARGAVFVLAEVAPREILRVAALGGFTLMRVTLGAGMRQRVGLARALAVEPDVLLMDEPFSALDVLTAESLRGELMELWWTRTPPTRAILLVTHNLDEAVLLADRVVVMGSDPGHVRAEVPIRLPQPRTREDADVLAVVDQLYQILTRPAAAVEARPVEPLPHARVGALAGFLELVAERGGRVDLHRLAGELHLELRGFLPLVDGAVMLGFAALEAGDVLLTPAGRAFVEASVLARKDLVRQALEARTTLVTQIHDALAAKANGRLPEAFFLGLLEQPFSTAEARRQLDTAIDWGRYAELFGFEEDTGELFLETT